MTEAKHTYPLRRPIMVATLGVLVAVNAADVVTTRLGITHGATEANPLMGPFAASFAALIAVKVAGLVAIGVIEARSLRRGAKRRWQRWIPALFLLVAAVGGVMVVGRNLSVLHAHGIV